jgi:hypothetical protein
MQGQQHWVKRHKRSERIERTRHDSNDSVIIAQDKRQLIFDWQRQAWGAQSLQLLRLPTKEVPLSMPTAASPSTRSDLAQLFPFNPFDPFVSSHPKQLTFCIARPSRSVALTGCDHLVPAVNARLTNHQFSHRMNTSK